MSVLTQVLINANEDEALFEQLGNTLTLADILLILRKRLGYDPNAIRMDVFTGEDEQWALRNKFTKQLDDALKLGQISKKEAMFKAGLVSNAGLLSVMPMVLAINPDTGLVEDTSLIMRTINASSQPKPLTIVPSAIAPTISRAPVEALKAGSGKIPTYAAVGGGLLLLYTFLT